MLNGKLGCFKEDTCRQKDGFNYFKTSMVAV
jgi:hypothetical protein